MDLSRIGRDDWLVIGGGMLLLIDLLFFPWHHESVSFGVYAVSASQSATQAPDAVWGVLALLVTIVVVVDLALARFSPTTQVPTSQLGRGMTRCVLAGVALLLLCIKLLANTSYLGFGAYLGLILAIAVAVGAYRVAAVP